MFHLVRQVRPPILHLGDAGIRIVRMLPLLIRSLVRSLPIQPRQLFARGGLDPRLLRQPLQELLIAFSRVPPHDRPQRGIRFQRGRVHSQRLPLQQPLLRQHSQHPGEHFPVRFHVDQPPRPRDRGMIRRRLIQPYPQKPPQRQRVICPPGDPALRIDPFEIADQQQPEVHSRRKARAPPLFRIEPPTPPLHKLVEAALLQQLVQALIERVARALRQRSLRNPHLFLLLLILPCSHRHISIIE